MEEYQALVNVTWSGQSGELPDPVSYDATDGDVLQWVTESIRGGSITGIDTDPGASLEDFVVDRFAAKDGLPNRISVRPKTPFGT